MLTAKGVKPICPYQQVFQSLYLFGAFSPIDGDSLFIEADSCNADVFQAFLDNLSEHRPEELKIMVLDNGAFHHAKSLHIPSNIELIFLPPYSPELNPAECIWKNLKRKFTNLLCKSIEDVSAFITSATQSLTPNIIQKTCSFAYIFEYLDWTT
jgi:transposase